MPSIKSLSQSPGLRQSAILSGGNILSTGISAISIILLSRFMGPEEFGAFSVAFALSMLTTKIFDFGLNMSLQKYIAQSHPHHPDQINGLATLGVKVKAAGSVLILASALIFSSALVAALNLSDNTAIVILGIGLGVIVYWFDFLAFLFQGLSLFTSAALLASIQALTKVAVIIALIASGSLSAFTTYLGYGLAPITGILAGLFMLKGKISLKSTLNQGLKRQLVRMTKFTAVLSISAALTDYLDILMVQKLTSQYETGLYSAATRITLLIAVVAFSINSVLNTRVSKYTQTATMIRYLKKASLFALISCLSIILLLPFSKLFLLITAGAAYFPADPALKYLLASGLLMLATAPLASVFYGIELPGYFAVSGVVQVSTLVLFNLILVPELGITGAGLARLLMRACVLLVTVLYIIYAVKRKPKFIQAKL